MSKVCYRKDSVTDLLCGMSAEELEQNFNLELLRSYYQKVTGLIASSGLNKKALALVIATTLRQ